MAGLDLAIEIRMYGWSRPSRDQRFNYSTYRYLPIACLARYVAHST